LAVVVVSDCSMTSASDLIWLVVSDVVATSEPASVLT
jgi:hypothetical protein